MWGQGTLGHMITIRRTATLVLIALSTWAAPAQGQDGARPSPARGDGGLFQVSTLGALSAGLFQGAYPVGLLRRQGDFGLGAYEGIDGEMIVLDGRVYHARADGSVVESKNDEMASFAAVVHFVPQRTEQVSNMTMAQLNSHIASLITSDNYFYAVRIHGRFSSVTTRAIAKQTPPYPTLAEAIKQQVVFKREDVQGSAVVLRSPPYMAGLNVAGDHYHFISDDHQYGGHALDLTVEQATLEIQEIRRNTVYLPQTDAFQQAPLPAPGK